MDENGKRQKAVSKRLASPAGKESVAGGKMRRLALRRPVKPQCAQLAIAQLRAANANQIQTAMRAGKQLRKGEIVMKHWNKPQCAQGSNAAAPSRAGGRPRSWPFPASCRPRQKKTAALTSRMRAAIQTISAIEKHPGT